MIYEIEAWWDSYNPRGMDEIWPFLVVRYLPFIYYLQLLIFIIIIIYFTGSHKELSKKQIKKNQSINN